MDSPLSSQVRLDGVELTAVVSEGGGNFSAGQRQLISLVGGHDVARTCTPVASGLLQPHGAIACS